MLCDAGDHGAGTSVRLSPGGVDHRVTDDRLEMARRGELLRVRKETLTFMDPADLLGHEMAAALRERCTPTRRYWLPRLSCGRSVHCPFGCVATAGRTTREEEDMHVTMMVLLR